jgi:thiol peroxidase
MKRLITWCFIFSSSFVFLFDAGCDKQGCWIKTESQKDHTVIKEKHMRGTIDAQALHAMIRSGTKMVVLDARQGKYDDSRRIPRAGSLSDNSTLEQALSLIGSKDALVVTYCANTHCPASNLLADHLSKLGFTNVVEYPEGIDGWTSEGLPVVKASESTRTIAFKGSPMKLSGMDAKVGEKSPNFVAIGNDMSAVSLSSMKGKVVVLVAVPSLDTPVCDIESKRFNEEAAKLGDDVEIIVISEDLPFAQKRWCGANDIKNLITVSDYKLGSFGRLYGVYIDNLGLLARSIFVVDKEGILRYKQIVPEVTSEPNYAEVIEAAKKIVNSR